MAENNANNGNRGSDPATPSKRAEKKQDTRPTPERMKQKETGTMEINLDVVMEIQDPPKLHSTNKEEKKSGSKEGRTIDMMTMGCESTPPSTPGRKGDKGQKKENPKKKMGPKLELSNKEKDILSKWPTTGYGPGEIFGEGDTLHDHEKKVRNNIPDLQGSSCPKIKQYQVVLKQLLNRNKIDIQKTFAKLIGTQDVTITPKEYWKDGKRPISARADESLGSNKLPV